MTLVELRELNNKYNDGELSLDLDNLLRQNGLLKWENRNSEQSLAFWSRILDSINDKAVKRLIYTAFAEYIFYKEKLKDVYYDLDELAKACEDDRCFIFDFAPGDFIKTKYGDLEKVTSVTMDNAGCWPTVNTEKRYVQVCEEVVIEENSIGYPELEEYHKVDNVQTYGLYNKYGECDDYYWK